MLNKRGIFVLVLLIMAICALSVVSANDSADDVINCTLDEIDELNECNADLNSLEIQDNGIFASSDDGTFTALQKKINEASEGSIIILENDYSYNRDFEDNNGVKISKSLTINGNGHVIDGLSKSSLLHVSGAKRVVLNNITFKNGIKNDNHAVEVMDADYFKLNGCNFVNNKGAMGGAVRIDDVNTSSIVECKFENNEAINSGGAIRIFEVNNSSFVGCSFVNNNIDQYGGAILFWHANHASIVECNFTSNRAGEYGGAVCSFDSGRLSVAGCSFEDNVGGNAGAIILLNVIHSTFDECRFVDNNVSEGGGAVILDECNVSSFNNCSFSNNSANDGGSIFSTHSNNLSFVGCDFSNNYAEKDGGAMVLGHIDSFSVDGCSFVNDMASSGNGGVIFSYDVTNSSFEDCSFKVNRGMAGGSIYLERVISQFNNCSFFSGFAIYGGFIHLEKSDAYLNNLKMYDSLTKSFGGSISSRYSNITLKNSDFKSSVSAINSGGFLYNFKGNLNISNSSFVKGNSKIGGAISSIDSNLTVSSSKFINNFATYYGGSIYTIYGNACVDGSLFNISRASLGCAINSMMADSLTFTNNIFLNSSSESPAINIIYTNDNIVESGNHFEDAYHVILRYMGYVDGETFTVMSKTLNYVLSNDGTYLNNYNYIKFMGDSSDYVDLNLWDPDYPDNSIIYGDYGSSIFPTYNFTKSYSIDEEFEYLEELSLYVYAESREIADIHSITRGPFFEKNGTFELNFKDETLKKYNHLVSEIGSYHYPASLINTTLSDAIGIPSAYDSRSYGYITSVKNQENAGNCWAFAGLATLEACIKKATGIAYDFSENNAKNLMALYSLVGLSVDTNVGGYDSMLMAYLNSWLGPISDSIEGYDAYSTVSAVFYPRFHVQNIYFLPARQNGLDNDLYKKAIMDYGAVSITFNWVGEGLHAVSLVGWDDNYRGSDSLGNYAEGAWIFKNSWGSKWGNDGFGYLAYQHAFTSDLYDFVHAYTFIFNKDDSYINNYQYDDAGVSDYLCSESHVFYSTKFKSEVEDVFECLSAFSTYFKYPTEYKVSVYVNGTLTLTQSGFSNAGYYTIPLNEKIMLKKGDEFVIMVENCNSGENYFPVCQVDELNRADFEEGISLFSYDGKNWYDLYDLEGYHEFLYGGIKRNTCQVACIKAFTSRYNSTDDFFNSVYAVHIDVDEFNSLDLNQQIDVDVAVSGKDIYYGDVLDSLINTHLLSININGKDYYAVINNCNAHFTLSFDNAGEYLLTAQYKDNLFESNIVQFKFTVNRKNTVISASSVSKIYGGSENSIITLKDDRGNAVSNAVVYFTVAGSTTKLKTNANGQAIVPINLAPKTYTATVSFAGGGNYNGATAQVNIVIKKASAKITAKKLTLKAKKTKKYTVLLKDNWGRTIKKVKVTLKIKGKTYKATTNANGKATFKVKFNKKASLKATIKFAGNVYYNAVTKKVKITVKK